MVNGMRKALQMIDLECSLAGVSQQVLRSGCKTRTVAELRQRLLLQLRDSTALSWREIGDLIGYRSRPTTSARRVRERENRW